MARQMSGHFVFPSPASAGKAERRSVQMFRTNKLDHHYSQAAHAQLSAEQIARALGGKRSGRQWICCCPTHDDRNPSLLIFDGHTTVQFRCLAGCAPLDVIAALRKLGILKDDDASQTNVISSRTLLKRSISPPERGVANNQQVAIDIWDNSIDPCSTIGEIYLNRRSLQLPRQMANEVVRFHPRCPRGTGRDYSEVPALIVLMRNYLTKKPQAIQRIFIDPMTQKKDRCKVSRSGAMMLGPASSGAMMLTSWFEHVLERFRFLPEVISCRRV